MSDRDARSSVLGPTDLYLFNEGTHTRLYEKLGAHVDVDPSGRAGVRFSVWAPNAERVSVIGDYNGWDDAETPLSPVESSGIWIGFVPDLTPGALYKYRIWSRHHGYRVDKADPFGFR
ncbi:MAG TPA: 1,4-alpha-glucan branching enzyme, partial [Sandaracinaceae bacterium]